MAELKIHHAKINAATAEELVKLCPFSAISYENGQLAINAACKMCRICVKKGPAGAIEEIKDAAPAQIDKTAWRGVAVFADCAGGHLHPVALELLGKARELAAVTGHPVYAVLIGHQTKQHAERLIRYGADKVFTYDHSMFSAFRILPFAEALSDFIRQIKPSSLLVGATNIGRSLAPRVAARFKTGLTADCTVLQMKENTDLVQIRPAFGGNIMAQIISPNNRPQFCTVRYKVFSEPQGVENPAGTHVSMAVSPDWDDNSTKIIETVSKPKQTDISEAEVILAVGRGLKNRDDLETARQLADLLGATLACTRPLIENGWMDATNQIGLSGKTVQPKLIVTLGISGSVQFAAGMKSADCIIAVNSDENAPIFDIAHYCIVGDLYKVLPELMQKIREEKANV